MYTFQTWRATSTCELGTQCSKNWRNKVKYLRGRSFKSYIHVYNAQRWCDRDYFYHKIKRLHLFSYYMLMIDSTNTVDWYSQTMFKFRLATFGTSRNRFTMWIMCTMCWEECVHINISISFMRSFEGNAFSNYFLRWISSFSLYANWDLLWNYQKWKVKIVSESILWAYA